MKKIYLIVLSAILFCSCSQRLVDFTIISTKNVDLSRAGTFERFKQRSEGKDVAHMILCFPIGTPNMKEAIDRALERIPGAIALVDGVVYYKSWWAVFYGQNVYVVEGTPLIDPRLALNSGLDVNSEYNYMAYRFDKKGDLKSSNSISEKQYEDIKSKISKRHEAK